MPRLSSFQSSGVNGKLIELSSDGFLAQDTVRLPIGDVRLEATTSENDPPASNELQPLASVKLATCMMGTVSQAASGDPHRYVNTGMARVGWWMRGASGVGGGLPTMYFQVRAVVGCISEVVWTGKWVPTDDEDDAGLIVQYGGMLVEGFELWGCTALATRAVQCKLEAILSRAGDIEQVITGASVTSLP